MFAAGALLVSLFLCVCVHGSLARRGKAPAGSLVSRHDFDVEHGWSRTGAHGNFSGGAAKQCQVPAETVSQACPAADDKFSLAEYALERRRDDHVAVRHYGPNMAGPLVELTYGDVKQAAYFAANLLAEHGIRSGDTVFIMGWNSWEMAAAYWGAHYLGAVVPVATPTHGERRYLLKYTMARAVVAPRAVLPQLRREIDDRTHVKLLLLTDNGNHLDAETSESLARPYRRPPCEEPSELGEFDADAPEDAYVAAEFDGSGRAPRLSDVAREAYEGIRASSEALWYFTSGTTGKPKGCAHKQVDLAFAAESYGCNAMGFRHGETTATDVMMAGPYAMGSNLVFPFICGATVFLDHKDMLATGSAPLDMLSAESVRRAGAQVLVSIPLSVARLARELHEAPSGALATALREVGLRVITSAGAPLPPSTYVNFKHASEAAGLKIEVLDGIGTSELQHIFITNFPGDVRSDEGSVGRVVPGYEAKLLHQESLPGRPGWLKGELAVRTARRDIVVSYATRRQPRSADYSAKTREVLVDAEDGGAPWYVTGDVAVAGQPKGEAHGHQWFYLLGRQKDLATQIGAGGGDRGLGLEDYDRSAKANAVMLAAGLYRDIPELQHALGATAGATADVLVTNVYPIKLDGGAAVFVVAVSKAFWPPQAEERAPDRAAVAAWRAYIAERTGVGLLVFVPEGQVPRTAPPLLKPKPGVMKDKILAWLGKEGLEVGNVDEEVCLQMSLASVMA